MAKTLSGARRLTIVEAAEYALTVVEGITSITRDYVEGAGRGYVWHIASSCTCHIEVWMIDECGHKAGETNVFMHCREHEPKGCGCRKYASEDTDPFQNPAPKKRPASMPPI